MAEYYSLRVLYEFYQLRLFYQDHGIFLVIIGSSVFFLAILSFHLASAAIAVGVIIDSLYCALNKLLNSYFFYLPKFTTHFSIFMAEYSCRVQKNKWWDKIAPLKGKRILFNVSKLKLLRRILAIFPILLNFNTPKPLPDG